MLKVLVTGVAGFVGAHVAKRFLDEGFLVVGVDDFSSGRLENIPAGLDFIQGNLALPSTIASLPKDCNLILHLAGQSSGEISFDNPLSDLEKNTVSSLNLIRYGIQNNVERLVYASSMSVYGSTGEEPVLESHACSPLSCYGVSKLAVEGYLRVFKDVLPSVCMRMFNVYGPGQDMANLRQGMVSIFLAQALATGKIEVKGNTDRFRDFIFIDDVVEAWYRAATYPSVSGQALNIGTGVRTTVASLLAQLSDIIPGTSHFINGETLGDQSGIYADTQKIESYLGMRSFISLELGLRRFLEWAKSVEE